MFDVKRQRVGNLADREAMLQQDSLTAAMLRVMSNSARAGGSSNSNRVAEQIENIRGQIFADAQHGTHTANLVADGRFALGANDGAYLRQNVMPLQTSDFDITDGFCDERWSLAAKVPTALQASGRTGVIDAIQEEVERELKSQARELKHALSYVGWLLTIPEILSFTQKILGEKKGERAEEARRLVDAFQDAIGPEAVQAQMQLMTVQSMDDLMAKQSTGGQVAEKAVAELQAVLEARMEVLVSVRVLFGAPTELMRKQLDHVLSTSTGTGTRQVYDAINGLAHAARYTKAAYNADKVPVLGKAWLASSTPDAADAQEQQAPAAAQSSLEKPTSGIVLTAPSAPGVQMAFQQKSAPTGTPGGADGLPAQNSTIAGFGRLLRGIFQRQSTREDGLIQTTVVEPGNGGGGAPAASDGGAPSAAPAAAPVAPSVSPPVTIKAPVVQKPPDSEPKMSLLGDALRTLDLSSETGRKLAVDAIVAGSSQLREDGGIEFEIRGRVTRETGVSAYWPSRASARVLGRKGDENNEFWRDSIWPFGSRTAWKGVDAIQAHLRLSKARTEAQAGSSEIASSNFLASPGHVALVYCFNRGLCGHLPPHRRRHSSDPRNRLLYSMPRVRFPGNPKLPSEAAERAALDVPGPDELNDEHCLLPPDGTAAVADDFVIPLEPNGLKNPLRRQERIESMRIARWAPVKPVSTPNDTGRAFVPDFETKGNLYVANAVVYEHLVDYYNIMAAEDRDRPVSSLETLYMGAAAAAKIAQLNHLASLSHLPEEYHNVAPAYFSHASSPSYLKKGEIAIFVTRPVAVLPSEKSVLYPCDAGLACYTLREEDEDEYSLSLVSGKKARSGVIDQDLVFTKVVADQAAAAAAAAAGGGASPPNRTVHYRNNMGAYLRKLLAAGSSTRVPIYVATAPGLDTFTAESFSEEFSKEGEDGVDGVKYNPQLNQEMFAQKDRFPREGHSCSATVRHGVNLCRAVARLVAERGRVIQMRDNSPDEVNPDDVARIRRDAVWNDSLREACIAGDRLYAFVRQLSGTISENVDAVCQIDEGMLVRQQQQLRERRARIADRAAQEHMQLVRNVFSTVIRESGLTLGIANGTATGDLGQLKVVSNTLRKQVAELAQGNGNDGFFANSVRLENLLSNGTGEMTLQELFTRLDEAGRALQMAAARSTSADTPGTGTSLDFLSAPRNSLMLRYKPDALAAIRSAFDIFQKEMLVQHGRLYRTVSAYELMEGNDEALCNAFASFCAHMLVHSRMYSSSTAMYVAAWPAAANAQQLRVSLQRLVQAACSYLRVTAAPNFLATDGKGRSNYFANAPSGGASGAPGLALLSGHLVPSGVWALNMYGNC